VSGAQQQAKASIPYLGKQQLKINPFLSTVGVI